MFIIPFQWSPKKDKMNLCCKGHHNDYLWWEWMTKGGWGNFGTVGLVMFLDLSTVGASGKEPTCQSSRCKRRVFDPWAGKIPWKRNGNSLQYSCLENAIDRGGWWAIVHRVAKSWTWLKWLSMHYLHKCVPSIELNMLYIQDM